MAQTFRENAAGLKDAASKNLGKFGEGFDESLEKNRKLVADFIGTGLDAIGGPKEGPKGKESESPFVLPTEPKEDKEEGGKAGEFEDLLSLNKRIAAGAAKTPEQRELEQGNDIARQQLEAIKGLRQDTQDNTEQLANLELKAPNQGGTFVA
jgi:hypothetical protein